MIRGRFTVLAVAIGLTLVSGGIAWAATSSGPSTALIAYVRGNATTQPIVWLAHADGSHAHALAPGDEALLSPSGAYLAVSEDSSHGPALIVYSTATGSSHRFFSSTRVSALPLAWSASSGYLAVGLTGVGGGTAASGLAVLDMSTFSARTVAHGVIHGASFEPGGGTVVYGRSASLDLSEPVDLYVVNAGGGDQAQLTTDGRSLNPVWGADGIVFDRETLRGQASAPEYQLWLESGAHVTQLTHLHVATLLDGLVPVSVSANGNRLLAEYQGEDTDYAWTVQLSPLRVKPLRVAGRQVQGAAIAGDGQRLLVDVGGFEQPADNGTVESVGFDGGAVVKLVRGAGPSWDG